jgi:hypothetical protein
MLSDLYQIKKADTPKDVSPLTLEAAILAYGNTNTVRTPPSSV